MLSYEPLRQIMECRHYSYYDLMMLGICRSSVYRIRKNIPVTMKTLDSLCRELECNIEDIIVYKPE